jgi:hypothetical protein
MAQAFEAMCTQLDITRADEREVIARRIIDCAKRGTLNRQDICKMVVSEFLDSKKAPRGSPPDRNLLSIF